jgi:hypothetical protein
MGQPEANGGENEAEQTKPNWPQPRVPHAWADDPADCHADRRAKCGLEDRSPDRNVSHECERRDRRKDRPEDSASEGGQADSLHRARIANGRAQSPQRERAKRGTNDGTDRAQRERDCRNASERSDGQPPGSESSARQDERRHFPRESVRLVEVDEVPAPFILDEARVR